MGRASRFALAVTASNIPIMATMAEAVFVEPSDAGCRVTYRQGLRPRRRARWLLVLVAGEHRKSLSGRSATFAASPRPLEWRPRQAAEPRQS